MNNRTWTMLWLPLVGARIKIMWEEQLVDPPKEYIIKSLKV